MTAQFISQTSKSEWFGLLATLLIFQPYHGNRLESGLRWYKIFAQQQISVVNVVNSDTRICVASV